ncbi:unnamed protein product [Candida verbasci]|uniref:CTLH/CRA C-terminal to LisH motif domain-containing protein n=1 Tax=Candida verbasci TaxID=1227364 RepID=A0A9W4X9N7_9ASCO|nr:unnamed protein product [Candida verbasci]
MATETILLNTLTTEVTSLDAAGDNCFKDLLDITDNFLSELKLIESNLQQDLQQDTSLSKLSDHWYKSSINNLKSYNTSVNKFQKNILNNTKFNVDLDDAYTYPLIMDSFPTNTFNNDSTELKRIKMENREELIKSIILHLLKIGQCDIVPYILEELSNSSVEINQDLSKQFENLNKIVDDITVNHDLSLALTWFNKKYNESIQQQFNSFFSDDETLSNIEFKFHMLQFIILLNGNDSSFSLNDTLNAYLYAKDNFSKFFKDYLTEISPLMTLLLFQTNKNVEYDDFSRKYVIASVKSFIEKMKQGFDLKNDQKINSHGGEIKFVSDLLNNFEDIHKSHNLFINLSNEFISEYCKDLKLSNDSSLFQSILAGHIYLPSFYKYNQIQSKLKRNEKKEDLVNNVATYHFELPFQLPDSNRFLFKYHPIFICPVSREQLVPITETVIETINSDSNKKRKHLIENPSKTQVVVLNYCQHLALKDSIWQLSKKGMDVFKCHYCYKKHKFNDITDAFFIDL